MILSLKSGALHPSPLNRILSLKFVNYATRKVYIKGGFRFLNLN
jgi:hypothetical protein